ncbi:MAG TPA: hypothetical protein VGM86_11235 [Thermoanaerobaculia bacterium]|jgi:hypothetical protein
MRKFSAIALVSCLTLGATAMYAQTTTSTSADKSATKTTTTTTKATTTKAKAHKVSGDISKLDCTANTLTVGTTDLSTNDKTTITVNGKKAACADLKDGMKATASYVEKDGKKWATHISAK